MRNVFGAITIILSVFIGNAAYAQSVPSTNLKEGEIWVNGRIVFSLQQAFEYVTVAGIIHIGPGVYKQAGILKNKHRVLISGSEGTIFDGVAAGGKAAFVIASNDITIQNITCRNITVKDRNGACVRFEGTNLILRNVTFTDSENGLLAGENSGKILIEDSVFERNGGGNGRAHSVYVNGGELTLRRSKFLSSKDQGHEIKSRAARLIIENCIMASMEGNDSRLIDIANGGVAIIRNSLLVEGPNTVNWQLFSYGVEKQRYSLNAIKFEKNVIVTDREGGSELILVGDGMPTPIIRNNIVVGKFFKYDWPINNFFYENREELNWPEAPTLPEWDMGKEK